jgi:hypothetical protein
VADGTIGNERRVRSRRAHLVERANRVRGERDLRPACAKCQVGRCCIRCLTSDGLGRSSTSTTVARRRPAVHGARAGGTRLPLLRRTLCAVAPTMSVRSRGASWDRSHTPTQ